MAESREKSARDEIAQLTLEIRNLAHRGRGYRTNAEYLFQEIGAKAQRIAELSTNVWEASRRGALEEAALAICYLCRMGIPVEPLSESLLLWHNDPNSGRLDICRAAAIRALKEKGE